jgi:hypothetical protein
LLFKWIKISFSVRTKKEKVSQPLQVRQYGFIKKPEKALPQAAFSKNPVISFSVLRAINPHGRWLCGFFLFSSTKDTLEKWFVCNSHLFARLLDVLCNFI